MFSIISVEKWGKQEILGIVPNKKMYFVRKMRILYRRIGAKIGQFSRKFIRERKSVNEDVRLESLERECIGRVVELKQ